MKIGIIGAMEEEIRLLLESMTIESQHVLNHQTFYEGTLNNRPVVLVQSGIGKVNATITTTLLIREFQIDYLINTGTAGGIGKGLKVGDIVWANSLMHHDVDVTGFGYEIGQMAGMPAVYYPDLTYVSLFKAIARAKEIEPILGMIVSGDQFINQTEKQEWIVKHFPKAKAVEMESAAIAQTAYSFNTPFIIIRAISDTADGQASISFDEFVLSAGKLSAQMVAELVAFI